MRSATAEWVKKERATGQGGALCEDAPADIRRGKEWAWRKRTTTFRLWRAVPAGVGETCGGRRGETRPPAASRHPMAHQGRRPMMFDAFSIAFPTRRPFPPWLKRPVRHRLPGPT